MKGFLIFLAVAFPVVLVSPFFWSLVRMEWSAERVGYTYHDGVTQWAMLGPKAPWPQWALVPEGAKLTVRAGYEPAPGHAAIGYGEIDTKVPPRESNDMRPRCATRAGRSRPGGSTPPIRKFLTICSRFDQLLRRDSRRAEHVAVVLRLLGR